MSSSTLLFICSMCRSAPSGAVLLLVLIVNARADGWPFSSKPAVQTAAGMTAEQEARIVCGTVCHAYPAPDILPRAAWAESIAKMTLFRAGLPEPPAPPGSLAKMVELPEDMVRVLAFYESRAPEALPAPPPWPAPDDRLPRFRKHAMAPKYLRPTPAISNVKFVDLDGDGRLEIVATDMRHGVVLRGDPRNAAAGLDVVADVPHPARVELADVDGDGRRDLLIADLGGFFPGDHEKGAVVWLRRMADGKYAPYDLGGFPRVADVRAADFDGDSKRDLLVGAFGWRAVGHIALLRNRTTDYRRPSFVPVRLDDRSGTINVEPADLDGDGRQDFIALISQQHEQVVAFLNRPEGFKKETIYAAPHPNWGSSGMDVVDLDGDKDLDVLLAHGDSFDDHILKPYHGIEWLENRGVYPYTARSLAVLPGVHPVRAIDLDRDGDLDVLAGSFLALGAGGAETTVASVVWLEQVKPGAFERRTLEVGSPYHATLDAADYDADGDIDLVLGNFTPSGEMPAWIEVWENLTTQK